MRPFYSQILMLLVALVFMSCDKDNIKNEEFDLWGKHQFQKELKMDGVYVNENSLERGVIDYKVFYRDGIILSPSSASSLEAPISADLESSGYFNDQMREDQTNWGAFDITSMDLKIQQPDHDRSLFFGDARIFEFEGTIINDTCFEIEEIKVQGKWRSNNPPILYTYRKLTKKPDSNCVLIEDLGAPCCPRE